MSEIIALNPSAVSPVSSLGIRAEFSTDCGTLRCALSGINEQNQQAALAILEALDKPPAAREIDQWIAAMHAGTKHRTGDTAELDLILRLYRATLARFSQSVARQACLKLTYESDWFPTVKEVVDCCEALEGRPKALLMAVRAWRPLNDHDRETRKAWGRTQRAREDLEAMNRRLGFVGDISKLSPERRSLWDQVCQQTAEVNRLEAEYRKAESAA